VRVLWSTYSAVMTNYPSWCIKCCFITEYLSPKVIFISFDIWQIGNGGIYRPPLKTAQSALCRYGGEGCYEQLQTIVCGLPYCTQVCLVIF
jgi:hypothetical protein